MRPFFVNPQTSKKDSSGKQDDFIAAAEKYIQENGTEAFENVIRKVFPHIKLGYCRIMPSLYLTCCINGAHHRAG